MCGLSFFRITNLKYWGGSETIISKTLQLLNDLSVGYGTVRKLVKLDEVGFLLSHHTAEHYPFLGVGVSVTEMRCRSMFYTSLGRLLMVDLGEDEEKFDAFMAPLTQAFENLGSVLLNSNRYVVLKAISFRSYLAPKICALLPYLTAGKSKGEVYQFLVP